jgi:hypothetical protein
MAKKAKTLGKQFSLSFRLTDVQFSIPVQADTLEEALAKGRDMKVSQAIQKFRETNECWDDFGDASIRSIWEIT